LEELETDLERITGRVNVLEKVFFENEELVEEKLRALGVNHDAPASEVYDALISKVEADDLELLYIIGHKKLRGQKASQSVVDFVKKIHRPASAEASAGTAGKGFFLKKEKAKQLLVAEPPKKIIQALGYKHVNQLIEKEDLLEVYSALRFLEDSQWQNKIFFKQYQTLRPGDFEERPIELRALSEKWIKVAQKFVKKKHHNVSHLKELGVIFVLPIFLGISGETLRLLSLLFHYLHEVKFYSELFRRYAQDETSFAAKVISNLRGDVLEKRLPEMIPEARQPRFLVIQRYLAKDDENDWRLFEPHINPEALHWWRAIGDLMKIKVRGLEFWEGMGWAGDFFKTNVGTEILVSFDLVDTVMSLVKRKELAKYLYHQQEALWNKIFIEYFGVAALEKKSRDYIIDGWFGV